MEGKVRQRRQRRFAYIGLAASCLLCLTWGITTWNNNSIGENAIAILPSSETNQPKNSIDKTHTTEQELNSLPSKRVPFASSGHSHKQNQQAETIAPINTLSTPASLPQDKLYQTEDGKVLGAIEKSKGELTKSQYNPAIASALSKSTDKGKAVLSGSTLTEVNRQATNHKPKALKHTTKQLPSKLYNPQKDVIALQRDIEMPQQDKKLKEVIGEEDPNSPLPVAATPQNSTQAIEDNDNVLALLPTTALSSLSLPSAISNDRLRNQLPIPILFPQLTEEELAAQKKKEVRPPSRWISSTFTPNYFNSNVQAAYQPSSSINTANSTLSSAYSKSAQNISKVQEDADVSSPAFSYVVGVSAGTNLAKRWMVEAGMQYINNSTDLQTHAYVQNTATSKKYPIIVDLLGADAGLPETNPVAMDANKLQNNTVATELNPSSTPITLRNQYQYIGIPIKLGYQLYQLKKLRLVISAGVSTDFFLRNTIKSSEADVPATVISSGNHSAYKAVNLNGLVGLSVHYFYANRFSIVLEPNYRAALFSTTKIASNVQALPRNIGLALGMKYHF
ncbi:MAG: outer membrane beta-barrel protein [Bacteroidota bacterium]